MKANQKPYFKSVRTPENALRTDARTSYNSTVFQATAGTIYPPRFADIIPSVPNKLWDTPPKHVGSARLDIDSANHTYHPNLVVGARTAAALETPHLIALGLAVILIVIGAVSFTI